MGGSSSSQTPVTQQTTQTRDPWGPSQPFLLGAMNSAQNLYNTNTGFQPYTGNTQASLHDWLQQGLGAQYSQAAGSLGGTPGVNAARARGTELINSYGLSPELQNLYNRTSTQDNPYLQGVINQQVGQANAAASGMGRYGSGAHDAAIAQAIAPTLSQDYARRQQQAQSILESGLQRQGNWSQLMPALDEQMYVPAQHMAAVGQYYTDYGQRALDASIKQYNAQQAYPWEQLSRLNAIVGGAGGLGGTQVTTQPGASQPSTLNKILGGAAAGAGIGSMFAPGIGTGIGALGGGLLGLM